MYYILKKKKRKTYNVPKKGKRGSIRWKKFKTEVVDFFEILCGENAKRTQNQMKEAISFGYISNSEFPEVETNIKRSKCCGRPDKVF